MSRQRFPLSEKNRVNIAILVAALGYFVDVYDTVLFSVVRVASLEGLGLNSEQVLSEGVFLLNSQLIGMLIGGVLWGVYGDKKGRIQVLFGSILLYSLANIANAFVENVTQYAILRFIAGVGLAGEIGAGITLVSELLPKEKRGLGTTFVATIGCAGAVAASLTGGVFDWRASYIIGGAMGLVLLVARFVTHESGMYQSIANSKDIVRGDLKLLFSTKPRIFRFLSCIAVGVPFWTFFGVIATFSPELAKALGVTEPVKAGSAVFLFSVGVVVGDIITGLLSQYLKSRKKVLGGFLLLSTVLVFSLLTIKHSSASSFSSWFFPIGLTFGYWAVFITTAAEQFGTNLRATVTTSVPNFVRGAAVPMTLLFTALKENFSALHSAQIVMSIAFILGFIAIYALRETFGIELNYIEENKPVAKLQDSIRMAGNL